MRILLLTVDFPPAAGGIQNLLAHLADGLADRHDVSVVAPRHRGGPEWDRACRYGVTRARSAGWWPLTMSWFLCAGLLRAIRCRPEVVVCGHALLGPVSWLIARLFNVPLIVMAYAYEIRAPRMRRLAGWTLRHAATVVTISEFTRASVIQYSVAPERIVVIHPGSASRPALGAPVAPPGPERIILTVARLGELYKGHDMMIRALPLILSREPHARYVMVGDGPLLAYLERLAVSVGVSHAVTFAGQVTDAELDAWYCRCDLFALLSRESPVDGGAEGFGIAFIEAGAREKPVLGGNSGGVPDAVVNGVTGLLVDPTDLGAIAGGVLRILGDADLARTLGVQGHDRAVNQLSWPNFVAAFQRVLDGLRPAAPIAAAVAPDDRGAA
ncbi:glycosyltransferase family 4 protein [soil metagenome]